MRNIFRKSALYAALKRVLTSTIAHSSHQLQDPSRARTQEKQAKMVRPPQNSSSQMCQQRNRLKRDSLKPRSRSSTTPLLKVAFFNRVDDG